LFERLKEEGGKMSEVEQVEQTAENEKIPQTSPVDVGKMYDSFVQRGGLIGLTLRGYSSARKHIGEYISGERQESQGEYMAKVLAAYQARIQASQQAPGQSALAEIDESMKKIRESLA
jgi:outer membrane receptor for ferric coprogen and ferric-rhodotorulic acid